MGPALAYLFLMSMLGWRRHSIREVDVEVIPPERVEPARNGGGPVLTAVEPVEETVEEPLAELEDEAPEEAVEEPVAEVLPVAEVPAAQPEPEPEPELEPELEPGTQPEIHDATCEIALWRGYRQASFYARMYVKDGEVAVAQSSTFRPTGKGELDRSEAAVAAHRALCDELERRGWTRTGRNGSWYGDAFRAVVTISDDLEEEEPAQA